MPEEDISRIKKEKITEKVRDSIDLYGDRPELLASIIKLAIAVLELLINRIMLAVVGVAGKMLDIVPAEDRNIEAKTYPTMSPLAEKYLSLQNIYDELQKQNEAIFVQEHKRSELEIELSECKGAFKARKREELQKQVYELDKQIDNMKRYLSSIVQQYGYDNVRDFYSAYYAAKGEYADYMKEVEEWKKSLDIENKPDCNFKFLKNVISGGETYTIAEKLSLCNSLKQVNNKAFIIDGFGFGEMGSATALKFGLSKYFLLMNGVEAMAVNPTTNQPLPLDKEGVLCITGPTLTDGYYKDSDSTKKSYIYDKNGKRWFKSDTYGAVHGRYRRLISLGGRVREYFITGDGHGNFLKVYSGKVESVILENANVKDCIVVPSDDSALPTPVAYYSLHNISKENENDIIKSIIESCNSLEEFCRPTAYYYETEIKRTKAYKKDYMYYKDLQRNRASNKIDYQKLEEKYREKNETL